MQMAISFHCQSCKQKIKAGDDAGGKWGKCPHCNIKCYIPLPPATKDEELRLLPLEEDNELTYQQQMREMQNLTINILQETSDDDEAVGLKFSPEEKKQLYKNIIMYLKLMADGELGQAEQLVGKISRFNMHAKEAIAEMHRAQQPEPELAEIAPAVLKGMMKNLVSQLDGGND